MPTYDFRCLSCDLVFELNCSMKNYDAICPSCNKNVVERLISGGSGVIFKGSGFYATDYRKSDVGGNFVSGDDDCKGQ